MRNIFFLFFFSISTTQAQNVILSGPLLDQEINEGDEFATDILGNPWDFSERRDIGWEENFNESTINVNNGAWSGTNASHGGYFFPLFPGYINTLEVDSTPGDKTTPKLGSLYRIDTNKYYHISYKMLHTSRSSQRILWKSDSNSSNYWPDGSNSMLAADGYYHNTGFTPNSGYNVYNYNMRSSNTVSLSGSWSGNIYALRMDPSHASPAGASISIDWLRVYDPTSAPNYTINLHQNSGNATTITTIWMDTNNSGYDGHPIAKFNSPNGLHSYSFPTAMLPPGTYYFYATVQNHLNGSSFGPISSSGYTGKLKINAKTDITITSPSTESGDDYSTSQVGNAWNMDSSTDLPNLNTSVWPNVWRQFTNHSFTTDPNSTDGGSVFVANADPPLAGNTESDVQIHMNISSARPINPQKYRYVTYRMWIDPSLYGNISDKVRRGWVSRPFTYWNNNILQDAGYIKGHVIYEGWHTYTVDLWKNNILQTGVPFRSFASIYKARLEPGEFDVATNFRVDFLKLTAESQPINNIFQIKYNLEDSDSSLFTVSLYYDNDNKGFDGTHIGTITNVGAGNNTFDWNTTELSDGEYFPYLIVNDGVSTSRRYALTHVRIGNIPATQPPSNKAELDYDGDGRTDLATYRYSNSPPGFFASQSSGGTKFVPWGGQGFTPIYGDFDGDGKSDFGLLKETGSITFAYIYFSSNDYLYSPEAFPFTGGIPAIEDYNGDGKDDIALYNKNTGEWHIHYQNGTLEKKNWGLPEFLDIPVPADYDGDGKADLCIWRRTSGEWIFINSSDGQFRVVPWGLNLYHDVPIPADYDNDGKADFAVFRLGRYQKTSARTRLKRIDPGSGSWFIRSNTTNATTTLYGTPGKTAKDRTTYNGDIPFVGDKNGDGNVDLMLFRRGTWYVNQRNGTGLKSFRWGKSGDVLPTRIR